MSLTTTMHHQPNHGSSPTIVTIPYRCFLLTWVYGNSGVKAGFSPLGSGLGGLSVRDRKKIRFDPTKVYPAPLLESQEKNQTILGGKIRNTFQPVFGNYYILLLHMHCRRVSVLSVPPSWLLYQLWNIPIPAGDLSFLSVLGT